MNYRWVILLIICGAQVGSSIVGHGWGPLAPFLKRLMLLSSTQIGMISSVFYLSSGLSSFFAGVVVDRYGVKKSLIFWLGLTGLPLFFLSFLPQNYMILLLMVCLAGLGYGMCNPAGFKGLALWFNQKTRATVFGMKQAAVALGGAIAGVLLVYVSQRNGPFLALRVVFWMLMIMLAIVFFFYKSPEVDKGHQGDELKGERSSGLRMDSLFNNRVFLLLFLVAGMFGMVQGIVGTFFPLYLNERLGIPLRAAGSLFSLLMIGGVAGRIFWGVMSDFLFKGRRKPVLMIISFLSFASIGGLAFWDKDWPKPFIILMVISLGLSSWGWHGITFAMVADVSDKRRIATALGATSAFSLTGLSLAPMGFGNINDYFGYFYAWASLAIICLASLFLCCLMPVSCPNVEPTLVREC